MDVYLFCGSKDLETRVLAGSSGSSVAIDLLCANWGRSEVSHLCLVFLLANCDSVQII